MIHINNTYHIKFFSPIPDFQAAIENISFYERACENKQLLLDNVRPAAEGRFLLIRLSARALSEIVCIQY